MCGDARWIVQLRRRTPKPCICLFAFLATPSDQAERLFHLALNGCWSEWRQTLKECESNLQHGGSPWLMRRYCPVWVRQDVRRITLRISGLRPISRTCVPSALQRHLKSVPRRSSRWRTSGPRCCPCWISQPGATFIDFAPVSARNAQGDLRGVARLDTRNPP